MTFDIIEKMYFKKPILKINQADLVQLSNYWEPEASKGPQEFRFAHCVVCGRRMFFRFYHLWINEGGFKKELHGHARCVIPLSKISENKANAKTT